jgi:hypothetical protein
MPRLLEPCYQRKAGGDFGPHRHLCANRTERRSAAQVARFYRKHEDSMARNHTPVKGKAVTLREGLDLSTFSVDKSVEKPCKRWPSPANTGTHLLCSFVEHIFKPLFHREIVVLAGRRQAKLLLQQQNPDHHMLCE